MVNRSMRTLNKIFLHLKIHGCVYTDIYTYICAYMYIQTCIYRFVFIWKKRINLPHYLMQRLTLSSSSRKRVMYPSMNLLGVGSLAPSLPSYCTHFCLYMKSHSGQKTNTLVKDGDIWMRECIQEALNHLRLW